MTVHELHPAAPDAQDMRPFELFEVIVRALSGVPMSLECEEGRRIYTAFLAASQGIERHPFKEARIEELSRELDLPRVEYRAAVGVMSAADAARAVADRAATLPPGDPVRTRLEAELARAAEVGITPKRW
jgi:hypothetical protein